MITPQNLANVSDACPLVDCSRRHKKPSRCMREKCGKYPLDVNHDPARGATGWHRFEGYCLQCGDSLSSVVEQQVTPTSEYACRYCFEVQVRELQDLLGRIIVDLPTSRDWLDPDIEKAARAALKAPEEL